MKVFQKIKPVVLFMVLATGSSTLTAQIGPDSVTGIYRANDGGFYYLRSVGNARDARLFWFGEKSDGSFSNVMVTHLNVLDGSDTFSTDNGEWWDVPKGRHGGAGSLSRPDTLLDLLIEGNVIRKTLRSGVSFGGARWIKQSAQPPRGSINLRGGFSGPGATGVWLGDDGGVYYIRQNGSDIAWFGEACSGGSIPNFANVFRGRLVGTRANGQWADVPYGRNNGSGDLSLQIEPSRISKVSDTGGFGGRSWNRSAALASTPVRSLEITVTTGGDDSRGGAVVYGAVELRGGRTIPKTNLNDGRGLANNSIHRLNLITLPSGTRLGDLVSFTLEHDGAPRNVFESYDNWNVDAVQIQAITSAGRICLASSYGAPFVRLTGETTFKRISVVLP